MADLETNAQKPKRFSGDTGSAEQHDLSQQIEYDRYRASKEAHNNQPGAFAGLRMSKCNHPSTE